MGYSVSNSGSKYKREKASVFGNNQFGFVTELLNKGVEYVATHKRSKTSKNESADNSADDEENKDDFPFFSCSNNIRKHIQDAFVDEYFQENHPL